MTEVASELKADTILDLTVLQTDLNLEAILPDVGLVEKN